MGKFNIRNMVLASMFLALAFVLPMMTGPDLGSIILPMHIPVLFTGMLLGPVYGLAVGVAAPLLRSVIMGLPPLVPVASAMAFELGAYGLVSGLIYVTFGGRRSGIVWIYAALLPAMVIGRVVWAVVMALIFVPSITLNAIVTSLVITSIPGIIIQLILIPAVIFYIKRAGIDFNASRR